MSFFKRIFGNKLNKNQSPVKNDKPGTSENLPDFESKVLDENNRTFLKFKDNPNFGISLPKIYKICVVCSRPTYPAGDKFAKVLILDELQNDKEGINNAEKFFLMREGLDCPNCGYHLCWGCIANGPNGWEGSGEYFESCSRCNKKIKANLSHKKSAINLLNDHQKAIAVKMLLISRKLELFVLTVDDALSSHLSGVDKYLARCFASVVFQKIENGEISELELRKKLDVK